MENNENHCLWDCKSEHKPLRRPNSNSSVDTKAKHHCEERSITQNSQLSTNTINQCTDTNTSDPSVDDIVNNSKLRANAKEWFPSSYNPGAPQLTQPAQSRLQRIKSENTIVTEDYNAETSHDKIPFDDINLDLLIQSLIYDPGQFDNLADNFIAMFAPHLDDVEVAMKTAEIIVDHALREPSFRYNAARLCYLLDEQYPLFRAELHMLCEKELNSETQNQGLTLFLAELYMQLNYEAIYGRCVLVSLMKLISSGKAEDIKSACQALKLAGYSLESSNKKALDEIFENLAGLKSKLHPPLPSLIESVSALRGNNWGRSINTPVINNSIQDQNGMITPSSDEEFVLYGPDGQEITPEEQEFLYSNFSDDADYLGDESSDPDDLYNPEPEMDKEIQEAFREFVKLGKR